LLSKDKPAKNKISASSYIIGVGDENTSEIIALKFRSGFGMSEIADSGSVNLS